MNRVVDINFNWSYSPSFSDDYLLESFDDKLFTTVNLPHTNIELPFNNFDEKLYQFESCYKKSLFIEELTLNERVYINFGAVMVYARLFCNGNLVGEHKGGYTPFSFDITEFISPGSDNTLTLHVDSRERKDIPPFGFVVDYLTYGGVYREVSLEYKHSINTERVLIKPSNVLDQPIIDVDLFLRNTTGRTREVAVYNRLWDKENLVREFKDIVTVTHEKNSVKTLKLPVTDEIKLWDIDSPNLYYMETIISVDGEEIERVKNRFGFRDAQFKNDGFYLNGLKTKIMGLNRHQSYPYSGYAMPKSAQYRDAEILKEELAVNLVRLSHYPQSDHFMDRCDELGLLVFDEIPGWQHIGDEQWQDLAVESVREMILKDVNHPSVIIWGVRINESQDSFNFYERTNRMAKELDPTRATGGVRCIKDSELLEDVYTYNDFVHTGKNQGVDRRKKVSKSAKPYLVTEFNGHMFPTKKYDDEHHRLEHVKRHLNVLNSVMGEDDITGAIGWCMFDYNTHKDFGSGDKICYHGVMDMFRIPKHAAHVYSSQGSKEPIMYVANSTNIGEYAGSYIEDTYILTNCDSVKLYKNGTFIKEFTPAFDLYPNLKHPPVIIDDFLGDMLEKGEKFSKKDAQKVKKLMTKISKHGYNLSSWELFRMGSIFLKYGLNRKDGEDLYTKYFGGWGGETSIYTYEGYRGGELVKTVIRGDVFSPNLILEADNLNLTEDRTWDTTRCLVKLIDDHGEDIYYANDTFVLETEGPIEIIGPKVLSLIGGSTGFWVKTTGQSGSARVMLKSERFGIKNVDFTVEKI